MTDEAWKRGFHQLEFLVKEAAIQGEDVWPPSYAGFLGYCEKPHGEIAHKNRQAIIDGRAWIWSDDLHKYISQGCLPDKATQERVKKTGAEALKNMQDLFND